MVLVGCLHRMVLLYHIAASVLLVKGMLLEGYVVNNSYRSLSSKGSWYSIRTSSSDVLLEVTHPLDIVNSGCCVIH
jgi:hypothetical protein